MISVSNGRIIALSTPFGKRGWFYEEWTHGQDWERTQITAAQCPRITEKVLARERQRGQRWMRQEFECEFVETEESAFAYSDIERAFQPSGISPIDL